MRDINSNQCKREFSRAEYQTLLAEINADWFARLEPQWRIESARPDGDVELGVDDAYYGLFKGNVLPIQKAAVQQERMWWRTHITFSSLFSSSFYGLVFVLHFCNMNSRFYSRLFSELSDGAVPSCEYCAGVIKPTVVYFGENVPEATVGRAREAVRAADALLVVGSSLVRPQFLFPPPPVPDFSLVNCCHQIYPRRRISIFVVVSQLKFSRITPHLQVVQMVFSAFRFLRLAHELSKPIAILNIGPTRGDDLAQVKVRLTCVHDVFESHLLAPAGSECSSSITISP